MRTFWQHGFEATTIADLTQSMGIAPPSLYAAFGDKRALFEEAVARYLVGLREGLRQGLAPAVTRDAIGGLLRASAEHYTTPGAPRGCFVMSEPLLSAQRSEAIAAIEERIDAGRRHGDVPFEAEPAELAAFVEVLLAGMSARARDGAERGQLLATVERAMSAWPSVGDEPEAARSG